MGLACDPAVLRARALKRLADAPCLGETDTGAVALRRESAWRMDLSVPSGGDAVLKIRGSE